MKKIMFLFLFCIIGASLYAKGAIFIIDDSLMESEIYVIPNSVINSEATIAQNKQAYCDGKFVQVHQKTERRYKWFWSEDVTKTKMMFFNKIKGENEFYFEPEIISNHRFAWELVAVFLFTCLISFIVKMLTVILKLKPLFAIFTMIVPLALTVFFSLFILSSNRISIGNDMGMPACIVFSYLISGFLIIIFENKSKK